MRGSSPRMTKLHSPDTADVGWAKAAGAQRATDGVPTIPSPRPEARWWARRFAPLPTLRLFHPRQRHHQIAETVAADFEIAVLVERRAGRRQQHHRIGYAGGLCVARGIWNRDLERIA